MSTRLSPTISHIRAGRAEAVMIKMVEFLAFGWGLPVEYSNRVISISNNPEYDVLGVLIRRRISLCTYKQSRNLPCDDCNQIMFEDTETHVDDHFIHGDFPPIKWVAYSRWKLQVLESHPIPIPQQVSTA